MTARIDGPRCVAERIAAGAEIDAGRCAAAARYAGPDRRRGDCGRSAAPLARPRDHIRARVRDPRGRAAAALLPARTRRARSGSSASRSRWRRPKQRSGPPGAGRHGVPVTGFSLADLVALGAGSLRRHLCASARRGSRRCRRSAGRCRAPDAGIGGARRHARDGLEVLRVTIHAVRPGQGWKLFERARDLQRAVGGLHAFAPLPRAVRPAAPTTGYDDVKLVAAARLLVDQHPVDTGGLGAVRPEAGAGRADDGGGRRGRRGGRRTRGAWHAAEPDRRNSRQHPRGGTAAGRAQRPLRGGGCPAGWG